MELFIVEDMDPASPKMGGIARYCRQLLEYLANSRIKATLLGIRNGNSRTDSNMTVLIPIIRKSKYTGYEYLLRLIVNTPFLHIPESAIIHAQHPEYMLPFTLFRRRNPKILTIHGQVLDKIRFKRNKVTSFIYERVEAFVVKHSDIIIVVDKLTGEFYQRRYPWMAKPRLIPTGIDLNRFKLLDRNALRTKYGFKPRDKVVVYVGRLEKEKGADFLIDCSLPLLGLIPEALIVLIGDGRDREYLKRKVSRMELHRVLFMGVQEPDAIPEIMNCADVLALCSVYEGSPTVVKEALACGVPVVSTDVGDVREILDNEKIGRIAPRNEADFADALADVLLNEDREEIRMRCASVAVKFSFEQVGARITEIYRELEKNEKALA